MNSKSSFKTACSLLAFSALTVAFASLPSRTLLAQEIPDSVASVQIEGNETIPTSVILNRILTQPNRKITNRQLREDKRQLMNTRWFYSVVERFEQSPAGPVLVFKVHERPIVRSVRFTGVGSQRLLKEVRSWTGLKQGSPFDHVANQEAVRRIEQEYKQKGYFFASATLAKGGDPNDREVLIRIQEGPKVRVDQRVFEFDGSGQPRVGGLFGRQSKDGSYGLSPSAARLRTKLVTKESWFGLFGGLYKPETIDQDITALKQYYRGLGFFDIQITAQEKFSSDRSSVRIEYIVNEGVPFKVRNISLNGNHVIPRNVLRREAELQAGQYFNSLNLSKDVQAMLKLYGDRGHYFANVIPVPKFTEQNGIVDIVFEIDEDRKRYVRRVNGKLLGDHTHTQNAVLKTRLQVEPGDLANPYFINRGRSRLSGSGLFEPNILVDVVPVDPGQTRTVSSGRNIRGQSQETASDPQTSFRPISGGHSWLGEQPAAPSTLTTPINTDRSTVVTLAPNPNLPQMYDYPGTRPSDVFLPGQRDVLSAAFPVAPLDKDTIIRAQSPNQSFSPNASPLPNPNGMLLEGSPYNNQFQALPPGWVDINVAASEGQTGRLMMGAGVNSDAGIVGSFVWDERNFNLFNPPRTFADIIEGRAWRGAGQRFRVEAAPGDQVSRYSVSWTDPFFLYTDYSFGVNGFYFNRFYPDWDETRLGGQVSLGKQLTPEWSINAAIRLEDVEVNSPRIVTGQTTSVPELEAIRGSSFLSSIRVNVSHDTRDSTLLPTDGHFYDIAYEQAFGDFNYPRFEGQLRQYFTLHQRPDGSGRHVLTLAGNMGWSGDDTPAFERYFAGGFQSFRGFAFRGVTPRGADNISIGGTFQALGTVEYRMPVTADDMINIVGFTDFGSVENGVTLDNFRVTVGVGLRVAVPALGPVPLAFDFGFPVKTAEGDDERIFSFYVGVNR